MKQRDISSSPPKSHDSIKSHHIEEHRHDPYKSRGKLSEPTVCPDCNAVYQHGRWQWATAAASAHREICPACHRIKDNYPAGELTLSGRFVERHGDEIVALARNTEEAEKRDHPLQRIIDVKQSTDSIVITTTDIHLPRRIGHAVESAYKGDLDTHYDESGYFVRMKWKRDA